MNESQWVARLTAAIRAGEPINLVRAGRDNPPSTGRRPASRTIPANAIRTVLIQKDLNPDPRGLRINGASITGCLDLEKATVGCSVTLTNSRFSDAIAMDGSRIPELALTRSLAPGLDLDNAGIAGNLILEEFVSAHVRAIGAHIGGDFSMRGAQLTNPAGGALIVNQVRIVGSLLLNGGFTAEGGVSATGAHIGGSLHMQGGELEGPSDGAVCLDVAGAQIDGSVYLNLGFNAVGEVHAIGLRAGDQFNMSGAWLSNEGGVALRLDQARIGGSLFLDNASATGLVRANGAQVGGQFSLRGAHLNNAAGGALVLDSIRIESGLFLDLGFEAIGVVRALGARVGGQLSMRGAHLSNDENEALNLDNAQVEAGLLLDEGFRSVGTVRAQGARIGGRLSLRGAQLNNPSGVALALDQVEIVGGLFLDEGFTALGTMQLSYMIVGILVVGEEPPAQLIATGWSVRELNGALTDRTIAYKWMLSTQDGKFWVQPWHELAAVYSRQGMPASAKWLRVKVARLVTKRGSWRSKPIRWMSDLFTGYGYHTLRPANWLFVAVLSAIGLVSLNPWAFEPIDPNQAHMAMNPWLYGAASVLPAVTVPGYGGWIITSWWVAGILLLLKLFAWLQTALLLAGLTGVLKKD